MNLSFWVVPGFGDKGCVAPGMIAGRFVGLSERLLELWWSLGGWSGLRGWSWGEAVDHGRAWHSWLEEGQVVVVVVDGQRAIEVVVEFDTSLGVAVAQLAWRDLELVAGEGDRVVVGDGAVVLETEVVVSIQGSWPGAIGGV